MGAVYAAEHVLLGRPAAVKVLLPEHSASQDSVTRFFNEARAATSIRHPGIVEIYDFGYAPDGSAYIAMELLEGESLATRVRRGAIEPGQAITIARQIAGALAAAHDKGIVHRDLKPDNVFLVADAEVAGGERIKLLDFGIAKLAQEVKGQTKTRTGAVIGTPTYMAPEQCRGVTVDHRADLYSLGCLLFEMVSGRPPFVGEGTGDVLAAHIHVPPPVLRTVAPAASPELETLVAALLRKDPAHRLQSAQDVIAAIDRIGPTSARTGTAGRRVPTAHPVAHPAIATTLSGAAGNTIVRPRRTGIWIGMGVGAVAIVGIMLAIVGGDGDGDAGTGSGTASLASRPPAPGSSASRSGSGSSDSPTGSGSSDSPTGSGSMASPTGSGPSAVPPSGSGSLGSPPSELIPPAAPRVAVAIDSAPVGADVLIDGESAGKTPYRGDVPVGKHRFTIRRDGHREHSFDTAGDAPITATVTLEPKKKAKRVVNPNKSVNPFGD